MTSSDYQPISDSSRTSSESNLSENNYHGNKNLQKCKLDTQSSVSSEDSIDVYSSDNESCTSSDYNFPPKENSKNGSFSSRKSYTEVAPDGGWGWIICIATFMCHFVVGGTYYSYGIMLPHLIQQFDSDHVTISMIGSVLYGVTQLVGIFVAGFIDICGCRSLCVAGALFGAISFFAAAFLPNNVVLFMIVYAVFGGIGHGTITIVSIIICTKYFTKKRALAVGISRCGTGFGTVIMAPLVEFMLGRFGTQAAILVTAGFSAACCISGLLMKPIPVVENFIEVEEQKCLIDSGRASSTSSLNSNRKYDSIDFNGDELNEKLNYLQKNMTKTRNSSFASRAITKVLEIFANMFSLKYMSEIGFQIFNIQRILYYIGLMTISIYLPNMIQLQPDANIDSTMISYIVSIIGGANTLARILLGGISDLPFVNPIVVLIIANTVAALTSFAMMYCQTFAAFALLGFIFGFATAPGNSLTSVILSNLFGVGSLVTTFGMSNFFAGTCIIPGPSFVGWIFQQCNDNPNVPFYAASAILGVTAFLNVFLYLVDKYEIKCTRRSKLQSMYEEI